jgi:tripartite-type tricarboxylate transporter receptor subunit TctC
MMQGQRRWLPALAGLSSLGWLALASAAPVSAAEICPSGTIKIVVPFQAGGPVDTAARLLAVPLQKSLERTVVIENRAGASGAVGTGHVAQAPGDGCTVLMSYDTHGVNPVLIPNLAFDTQKDLRSVMLVGTIPNIIAVHKSRPWMSLSDLMAAAKGGELNYGTGGTGTIAHLATKLIETEYGVRMRHVPFRGGGPTAQAVLGNHVDFAAGSVLVLSPLVRDGSIRALVQTGRKRHPLLPGVPTATELGLKDLVAESWIGVFLPASTSDAVAGELTQALKAALADPGTRERMAAVAIEIWGAGRAELDAFVASEITRWRQVILAHAIKPD